MKTTSEEQGKPNGAAPSLKEIVDRASKLLIATPEVLLAATGEQVLIPVISKPDPLEYFRTHPTMRLTMAMVEPRKGSISSRTYAVEAEAQSLLLKHKILPFAATLFPIVIDSKPLSHKLVRVRLPGRGGWDNYNLTRKLVLDRGVNEWIAMRMEAGGYVAVPPHPEATFPAPVFPDWDENEWLQRSLYAADLVISDGNHEVFREIQHL
jgi:hypothetical protein